MIHRKFIDVYVNYKLVESKEVKDPKKLEKMKASLFSKHTEAGTVSLKSRTEVEVEYESGGCEGGNCPIRTK